MGRVLLLAALAAACRGEDRPAPADTLLARDLELARATPVGMRDVTFQDTALGSEGTPPQPAPPAPTTAPGAERPRETRTAARTPVRTPAARAPVTRAPVTRAPVETTPREEEPRPSREVASTPAPGGAGSRPSIGAGTQIALVSDARVCTSGRPGDKITATVAESVRGSDGAEIPRGTTVVLEIASVEAADPPEQSRIRFRLRAISMNGTSYPVSGEGRSTSDLERVQTGRTTASDRNKVIGGAIAGAVIGRVLGGSTKATVAGAAAGAATGAVVASRSGSFEGCMNSGAPLVVTLGGALVLGS